MAVAAAQARISAQIVLNRQQCSLHSCESAESTNSQSHTRLLGLSSESDSARSRVHCWCLSAEPVGTELSHVAPLGCTTSAHHSIDTLPTELIQRSTLPGRNVAILQRLCRLANHHSTSITTVSSAAAFVSNQLSTRSAMTTHATDAVAWTADTAVINVLVVGLGIVGKAVLDGLLAPANKNRATAYALVRPSTSHDTAKSTLVDTYTQRGVHILEGDLNDDIATLTHTLATAHIHTIVSTVGFGQYLSQLRLLDAAKAANVRHFFPSDYGFDTPLVGSGTTLDGMLAPKLTVQRAVMDSGLDYTVVCTGAFTETTLGSPLFGVDLKASVITAPGIFNNMMQFTSIIDIAHNVAHAVLNPSVSRNSSIYLGEPLSYQQVADTIDTVSTTPLVRRVRTTEQALAILRDTPSDYASRFIPVIDAQKGVSWPIEQTYAYQHLPGYTITTLQQLAGAAVDGAKSAQELSTVQSKAAERS